MNNNDVSFTLDMNECMIIVVCTISLDDDAVFYKGRPRFGEFKIQSNLTSREADLLWMMM